jgi:hypothetical protein
MQERRAGIGNVDLPGPGGAVQEHGLVPADDVLVDAAVAEEEGACSVVQQLFLDATVIDKALP